MSKKEMANLARLEEEAKADVEQAGDLRELDDIRVQWLGKKGRLTEQLKTLANASVEEKKTLGKALNELKQSLTESIEARQQRLQRAEVEARLQHEMVDITLPVPEEPAGSIHPISRVISELTDILADFGFVVAEGPDIEDDFHNFTALNFPANHPARLMHDTFFLNGRDAQDHPLLLRTHTSPVQVRTMCSETPPIRVIAPGATYRCDSDITHTPMFHQVEGLVIEQTIHFGHLKGILQELVEAFFGISPVPMRFRPSFFPFTEPSAEVDIGCKRGEGELVIGGGNDWMEILGCGMVHPNVLRHCGLDPQEWQGFAFGMGVERLAMLKYNIPDLRTFFDSDLRWLHHYGFRPVGGAS